MAKKPHKYHLTCKHEHTKQIEMCSDCGDIITSPMNQIILVHESFTSDVKCWVPDDAMLSEHEYATGISS